MNEGQLPNITPREGLAVLSERPAMRLNRFLYFVGRRVSWLARWYSNRRDARLDPKLTALMDAWRGAKAEMIWSN